MLSLAEVGEESLAEFKALVDIGDLLAVRARSSPAGAASSVVQATGWELAAKTLRPLPNEHKPLSDEARIRLRYVDMMIRPEPREMVRTKAAVLQQPARDPRRRAATPRSRRPILQLTNGGAAARPFRTHLNALDQPMLLRIALELDLKRAMIGGVEQGLRDRPHLPQRGPRLHARRGVLDARGLRGVRRPVHDDGADPGAGRSTPPGRVGRTVVHRARRRPRSTSSGEWRQASILDLVSEALGEEVTSTPRSRCCATHAAAREVELQPAWGAGEIVVELYEQLVEDDLISPTFVDGLPRPVKPLAKAHRSQPGAQRGVRPDHQRRRARAGVLRAQRPGGAAAIASSEQSLLAAQGRPGGDGARRGVPQGDGVRHAPAGRASEWGSTG